MADLHQLYEQSEYRELFETLPIDRACCYHGWLNQWPAQYRPRRRCSADYYFHHLYPFCCATCRNRIAHYGV